MTAHLSSWSKIGLIRKSGKGGGTAATPTPTAAGSRSPSRSPNLSSALRVDRSLHNVAAACLKLHTQTSSLCQQESGDRTSNGNSTPDSVGKDRITRCVRVFSSSNASTQPLSCH